MRLRKLRVGHTNLLRSGRRPKQDTEAVGASAVADLIALSEAALLAHTESHFSRVAHERAICPQRALRLKRMRMPMRERAERMQRAIGKGDEREVLALTPPARRALPDSSRRRSSRRPSPCTSPRGAPPAATRARTTPRST